jgi:hypothetical protein
MDAATKQALAVKNTATGGAKLANQVTQSFLQTSFESNKSANFTEGNMRKMLKARCERLTGRSTVIGNTVFAFDKDGVCNVLDQGNARVDFEILLQQNGVRPFDVAPVVAAPVVAAPVVAAPVVAEEVPAPKAVSPVIVPDAPVEEEIEPLEEAPVVAKSSEKKKKSIFGK